MASRGEQQLHNLVKRLIFATDTGRLEWQSTDRPLAFQCTVGRNSILVATVDDDGQAPYILEILDASGVLIESLQSGYATISTPGGRQQIKREWNDELAELHEIARRQVLNLDKLINDLLSQLPEPPSNEPPF
ncbi:hypothetical protein [Micromonospora haikouensis]|uniref:hypothetical protein n=1 Tax=Micromonospora haikouensis TaxID=686309 RepID=UPI0037A31CBB